MAHTYLCLWCGEHAPHDDWQHHTTLQHRLMWSDRRRCRLGAAIIGVVGGLLCLGSVVLEGTGSPLLILSWSQGWLLRLLGLVCVLGAQWEIGSLLLLLSWVLRTPVSLSPWLTPGQAALLWCLGLVCLADAAALWLSCWGLARYQAWQTERARWTAALREVHMLRRADHGRDA